MRRLVVASTVVVAGLFVRQQSVRLLQRGMVLQYTGQWPESKPNRRDGYNIDEALDFLREQSEQAMKQMVDEVAAFTVFGCRPIDVAREDCPDLVAVYEEARQEYGDLLWAAMGLNMPLCRHSASTIPADIELALFRGSEELVAKVVAIPTCREQEALVG